MLERPITFKVRLLSGREGSRQPQLSLLRRTFQPAADANAARATGESRLAHRGKRSGAGLRRIRRLQAKAAVCSGVRWERFALPPVGRDAVLRATKTCL